MLWTTLLDRMSALTIQSGAIPVTTQHLTARTLTTLLLTSSVLVTLGGCAGNPSSVDPIAEEAPLATSDIFDELATDVLRGAPEWASQLGVSEAVAGVGYASQLSNYGVDADVQQRELAKEWASRLRAVDASKLNARDRLALKVARQTLDLSVRRNEFLAGYASLLGAAPPYAVNQIFSAHLDLPRLLSSELQLTNRNDVEAFMARLKQLGPEITQVADVLERDAAAGVLPPTFILQAVADAARNFVTGRASANPIAIHLNEQLENVVESGAQKILWQNAAVSLIEGSVYPAYISFASRVEALIPQASDDPGIWRLPNGEAMYQMYLDNYGANGLTADDVHQLGLREVRRIEGEMDQILTSYGLPEGTAGERVRELSSRPALLAENTDEGRTQILEALAGYEAMIRQRAPAWFASLPDAPIAIKRIPEFAQDSSGSAYYSALSLDGSRPGTFWINLKDTADWPLFNLKSLFFHEGVPGHHFQALLQQGDETRLLDAMTFFSEYGEGWALYAEALALEMGAYEGDPLGNLGRLRMEIYRAARLVVDTGIHSKRWSRAHAIDWMQRVTGDTTDSVTREIDRYSAWPGQATSYKLGMIALQNMRASAEAALGKKFNIGEFHEAVLRGGMMPMPVLADEIDRWVQEQLSEQARQT